jgi:hypothetical protein
MNARQIDALLSIIDRAVKVAERWADREYPVADETNDDKIGISRVGDRPLPQSVEEYNAFEPQEDPVERFAKRIGAR